MNRKRRGLVETQSTQDINGDVNSYDRFVARHGEEESELANPDLLPEQPHSPSTPQLLMGEAIEHLQGRQRETYIAIMRDDKSIAEAADLLGVSKSTAQTHLERAIEFITEYCRLGMEKGRI